MKRERAKKVADEFFKWQFSLESIRGTDVEKQKERLIKILTKKWKPAKDHPWRQKMFLNKKPSI